MKTLLFFPIALALFTACKTSAPKTLTETTQPPAETVVAKSPESAENYFPVLFLEVRNEITSIGDEENTALVVYSFKVKPLERTYYLSKDGNELFKMDPSDPREIHWFSSITVPEKSVADTDDEYAVRPMETRGFTFRGIMRLKDKSNKKKTLVQAF